MLVFLLNPSDVPVSRLKTVHALPITFAYFSKKNNVSIREIAKVSIRVI